jgi:hypothetical protein
MLILLWGAEFAAVLNENYDAKAAARARDGSRPGAGPA